MSEFLQGLYLPRRVALGLQVLAVAGLLIGCIAGPVFGHGDVMRIGSSQPGGGQILIEAEFEFGSDVFFVPFVTQLGGSALYSDIFPSFAWILAAGDGIHPLDEEVSIVFTAAAPISTDASVRIGNRTLGDPGLSATLGSFENDPEAHVHPQWRLILPAGTTGTYQVSFRLSATGFTDSPVYTVLITNEEPLPTPTAQEEATATATVPQEATPTATEQPTLVDTATATATVSATVEPTAGATSTSTASPTATEAAPACPGDCDGNGVVAINELIRAVNLAGSGGTAGCAAADGNRDGAITINELIRAVRSALEGC